ncbi:hypothetical protein CEXT_432881 [Caerostris extrusa]|uniref:Transmembrane protein n=1 Tax=Caerostris extrusa TaxID=172846 RepID=A0AAV4MPW1_CAEEX|nr:hypothetical protein CEXT_432881 [Caerostris extrusa]
MRKENAARSTKLARQCQPLESMWRLEIAFRLSCERLCLMRRLDRSSQQFMHRGSIADNTHRKKKKNSRNGRYGPTINATSFRTCLESCFVLFLFLKAIVCTGLFAFLILFW